METIKVSARGQVALPKSIRESRKWRPGTELTIEETKEGVLLRPKRLFPPTKIEDVFGMLKYTGKPKTLEEMDQAITDEVKARLARGRY
jgi:AbrB family looped-hinge helix DNA binding protein